MKCPRCENHFTDAEEVEVIKDWGYCLSCDKLAGQEDPKEESELEIEDLI